MVATWPRHARLVMMAPNQDAAFCLFSGQGSLPGQWLVRSSFLRERPCCWRYWAWRAWRVLYGSQSSRLLLLVNTKKRYGNIFRFVWKSSQRFGMLLRGYSQYRSVAVGHTVEVFGAGGVDLPWL